MSFLLPALLSATGARPGLTPKVLPANQVSYVRQACRQPQAIDFDPAWRTFCAFVSCSCSSVPSVHSKTGYLHIFNERSLQCAKKGTLPSVQKDSDGLM